MPRYRLAPGATKIEMQDGTMFRGRGSSKRGMYVTVDNKAHASAIERAAQMGHILKDDFRAPIGIPERRCKPCDFTAWPWQMTCPKCGQPTMEEQ